MTIYSKWRKKVWLYLNDIIYLRLTTRVINVFFSLMIITLPFVNKFSRVMVLFYLLLFFRMIYKNKDFIIPYMHKLFLFGLFTIIVLGDLSNGISLESLKRMLYLAIFISLYYATLYFVRKNILKIDTFVYAIVISMTVYMINGYIQFFSGYDLILHSTLQNDGICSISKNRNIFGLAMFFYMALLSFLVFEKKMYWTILFLLFAIVAIILTLSRQIWITAILFFFVLIFYKHHMISMRFWMMGLVGIIAIVFLFLYIPELHERVILLQNGYSSGRMELWKILISHIPEAPLLGHGFHSPLNITGTKIEYDYAHNLTIGILFNLGIFGFLFYLIFIGYFLKLLVQCQNIQIKPYLIALFIALFMVQQQLGGSMLIHKFIGPSMMIFLAWVTSYSSTETFIKKKRNF
ncbi:Oligosaccharide repeat unit polymerase Wzy [hydrothermal vent metagenome]|uniref:Oligosaccharide repeat unit polymerase Wzy n=1 Tax=hydrothermal vent metagenome TaxID=652676 RepID=A0A1W1CUN6_9ZZZZ